jgi:hypothetical protein
VGENVGFEVNVRRARRVNLGVIRNRYALRGLLRLSVESPISKHDGSAKFVSPEDGSEIGYATQANAKLSNLKLGKHDGSVF